MATGEQLVTGAQMEAWQRFLRAYCVVSRTMDSELQSAHGMTISDYDVLVQLHNADGQSLTMGELSRRTLLTRSGMTRLVQGLERDGLVERRACPTDARVTYAALTESGQAQITAARRTHHGSIRRLFADHLDPDEAAQLAELLGRVPGVLEPCDTQDGDDGGAGGPTPC